MTNIALIGEAWGEAEERERQPFCGAAGYELNRMLNEAGIHRADCFITNVFNRRPRGNKLEDFCGHKSTGLRGYPGLGKALYIRAEFAPELERLGDELSDVNPNLVVALGNTAMWALLGKTAISKFRGTTDLSTHTIEGFKVLPTYHPAAVLRQWELRPVAVMDLCKARREGEWPEIRRPKMSFYIPETVEDLYDFRREYIQPASVLSVDIETSGTQITCIGFAPSPTIALVIPFYDTRRKGKSYWTSNSDEGRVWRIVRDILATHTPPKLFQNGLYDIAFLWRSYGIKVYGAEEDTMLLHHALQPESLKGLGFLASVYCDLPAWKQMRGKVETIKGDE